MKIAYVYDTIYPYVSGGVQRRIWELSRRLAARGHEVTIIGMKYWEGQDVIQREGVRVWGICPPKDLFVNGRRSVAQAIYFGWRALPALSKEKFDIIDCQNFPYFPCFSAKTASILKSSPLLITWHEVWGEYWYQYLGRKGFFGKMVEKMTARLARKNLVGTRHNAEKLASIGTKRQHIAILPMGGICYEKIDRIHPAAETTDIIFVGRLIKAKGVDTLLESIHYLKSRGTIVRLSIVGDGAERSNLEDLCRKLNIQDTVQFHGRIDDDAKVISLMKSARLFVYPASPEGGWSLSVIEANACGLPAVSVRSGPLGVNEVVIDGHNGLLADQQSPEALGAKIHLLLENEAARIDLSRNAVAFAREQDWDHLTARIEQFYSQVQEGT